MAPDTWFAFFIASWVISLSPGAGAIASMTAGLNYGFRRGFWNALGLQVALLAQIAIVAAGVGALLSTSALAFALVKWFGVIYLLYLGWRQWGAQPREFAAVAAAQNEQARVLLVRGFLVNASNPKAVIFILAVLPQFLDPRQGLLEQYLLMAATMVGVDLVVMAAYTGLAARILRSLRQAHQQRLINRIFGGLFVVAALVLASLRQASS